jgi:hypothetical protein
LQAILKIERLPLDLRMTERQTRLAIENEIRAAFRGVVLGEGMSIREDQLADRAYDARSGELDRSTPTRGVTHDWAQVSSEELERNCIAHLDALGFRYYIPALMLSLLDHYDPASMRVIGTLSGLSPKQGAWEYHMQRYSLLNFEQKAAIAHFLSALPTLFELEADDQKIVERAIRNYWREFLSS